MCVCVFTLYVKVILIKFKLDTSCMNLTMCLIYKMNQVTSE